MTRRVVEKLCAKNICVDFLAPKLISITDTDFELETNEFCNHFGYNGTETHRETDRTVWGHTGTAGRSETQRESNIYRIEGHHFASPVFPHFPSETGRIRFRRVRFQTPKSVSFLALTEFREENSVSSSQPIICVPRRTHRVFRRTHRACRKTQ